MEVVPFLAQEVGEDKEDSEVLPKEAGEEYGVPIRLAVMLPQVLATVLME